MPAERHTFKERTFWCDSCSTKVKALLWSYDPVPTCSSCTSPLSAFDPSFGKAHAVHGDEMDELIEHGVCHSDGTPRRFRSKEELKRVEAAKGWRRWERGDEKVGKEYQERAEARFRRNGLIPAR